MYSIDIYTIFAIYCNTASLCVELAHKVINVKSKDGFIKGRNGRHVDTAYLNPLYWRKVSYYLMYTFYRWSLPQ